MTYKFDYHDGEVIAWSVTDDGAVPTRIKSYTPTIYVATAEHDQLTTANQHLSELPAVERTTIESWRTGFRHDAEPVIRVDINHITAVTDVARTVARWGKPGTYRLYNVDLTREFRFSVPRKALPANCC